MGEQERSSCLRLSPSAVNALRLSAAQAHGSATATSASMSDTRQAIPPSHPAPGARGHARALSISFAAPSPLLSHELSHTRSQSHHTIGGGAGAAGEQADGVFGESSYSNALLYSSSSDDSGEEEDGGGGEKISRADRLKEMERDKFQPLTREEWTWGGLSAFCVLGLTVAVVVVVILG